MIEQTVEQLSSMVGTRAACRALGASVATIYRRRNPPERKPGGPKPPPPRAFTDVERERVLQLLYRERFRDYSPEQVYATLLDEGVYLCSVRTMYRILAAKHGQRHAPSSSVDGM